MARGTTRAKAPRTRASQWPRAREGTVPRSSVTGSCDLQIERLRGGRHLARGTGILPVWQAVRSRSPPAILVRPGINHVERFLGLAAPVPGPQYRVGPHWDLMEKI